VGADDAELTRYRREHVGFVFQFYNLIPSLTVLQNVALVNEIADKPLDPGRRWRWSAPTSGSIISSQLSGGEQQRVAVARAIVKSPDVLLCDELTGALDYETGKVVLAAIARVNEQLGTTTVILTHNAAIAGMADRFYAVLWVDRSAAEAAFDMKGAVNDAIASLFPGTNPKVRGWLRSKTP
jgi:putative ABC transport system ATP-binding protein